MTTLELEKKLAESQEKNATLEKEKTEITEAAKKTEEELKRRCGFCQCGLEMLIVGDWKCLIWTLVVCGRVPVSFGICFVLSTLGVKFWDQKQEI